MLSACSPADDRSCPPSDTRALCESHLILSSASWRRTRGALCIILPSGPQVPTITAKRASSLSLSCSGKRIDLVPHKSTLYADFFTFMSAAGDGGASAVTILGLDRAKSLISIEFPFEPPIGDATQFFLRANGMLLEDAHPGSPAVHGARQIRISLRDDGCELDGVRIRREELCDTVNTLRRGTTILIVAIRPEVGTPCSVVFECIACVYAAEPTYFFLEPPDRPRQTLPSGLD